MNAMSTRGCRPRSPTTAARRPRSCRASTRHRGSRGTALVESQAAGVPDRRTPLARSSRSPHRADVAEHIGNSLRVGDDGLHQRIVGIDRQCGRVGRTPRSGRCHQWVDGVHHPGDRLGRPVPGDLHVAELLAVLTARDHGPAVDHVVVREVGVARRRWRRCCCSRRSRSGRTRVRVGRRSMRASRRPRARAARRCRPRRCPDLPSLSWSATRLAASTGARP